ASVLGKRRVDQGKLDNPVGRLAGTSFAVKNLFDVEGSVTIAARGGGCNDRGSPEGAGAILPGSARGQRITSGELFEHTAAKLLREGDGFLLRVEIDPAAGRLLVLVENLKPARSVSLVVEPYPHPVHSFRQSACGD